MSDGTFHGKTAVVTGASSGIGQALALLLARQGANLALAARSAERLSELARECGQRGATALAVPTDVSAEAECRALIERTIQEFGRLDMLVNNAGIGLGARLHDLPDLGLFRKVVEVNFYGTVYCTYYALPHLRQAKGRIVNVSSLGGKLAIPFNTPYVASKFAVVGFSDSLRAELAGEGVSVTVICPYWVVTEFHERFMDKDGRPRGPRGRAVYGRGMMTAEECARVILMAARRRKREVLMGPGAPALWLKMIAPGLVDRLIGQSFMRPAIRRASQAKD